MMKKGTSVYFYRRFSRAAGHEKPRRNLPGPDADGLWKKNKRGGSRRRAGVLIAAAVILLCAFLCVGCASESREDDGSVNIYYLNKSGTTLVPVSYAPQYTENTQINDRIGELMGKLESQPDDINLKPAISGFTVQSLSGDGEIAYIDLSLEFNTNSSVRKALIRASIVNTLCQIDGVDFVQFTVDGQPMLYDREYVDTADDDSTASASESAAPGNTSADSLENSVAGTTGAEASESSPTGTTGVEVSESSAAGTTGAEASEGSAANATAASANATSSLSAEGTTSSVETATAGGTESSAGTAEETSTLQAETNLGSREVGLLSRDSFIYNSGNEIRNNEKTRLHLYFANKDGDMLVNTYRPAVYNSNMPEERLIVEEVLKGPNSDFSYPTLNPNTSIVSVLTRDKVCYVDLDRNFLDEPYSVTPEVAIYSLVNSLCELDSVDEVQISISGSSSYQFMDKISLSTTFEKNRDIVEREEN